MLALIDLFDDESYCWKERIVIYIDDINIFSQKIGVNDLYPGIVFEIDETLLLELKKMYDFEITKRDINRIEVIIMKERKYDYLLSHTGRELDLMLEGKKPFSAFIVPQIDKEITIFERIKREFEEYVSKDLIIKMVLREEMALQNRNIIPVLVYTYTIKGEEWRSKSFEMLRMIEKSEGWNPAFEKIEGFLYGYSEDIDSFFRNK